MNRKKVIINFVNGYPVQQAWNFLITAILTNKIRHKLNTIIDHSKLFLYTVEVVFKTQPFI